MIFEPLNTVGTYRILLERKGDDRGFFSRVFCKDELKRLDLSTNIEQVNTSFSAKKGTLRGMHYQLEPCAEVKIVKCLQGCVFDVVVDLRPESPTYRNWESLVLSSENKDMVYIPKGCAHGFMTMVDNTELLYLTSTNHNPVLEAGIQYDDPAIGIEWPFEPTIISEKDTLWEYLPR